MTTQNLNVTLTISSINRAFNHYYIEDTSGFNSSLFMIYFYSLNEYV